MSAEHFIPFDKTFLLERQIADLNYFEKEAEDFKKLFRILEHHFHNEGFEHIKKIKSAYSSFDPDKTGLEREEFRSKDDLKVFNENLLIVLQRGNYKQAEEEVLNQALNNSDLVGLQLKIHFDYFKDYKVFIRGTEKIKETITRNYFWKKEQEFEYFDRVIMYIEYKDLDYFKSKKINISKLPFTPSTINLKIFKRVPKNDLETIFPNADPQMSLKDKLLLWVPAIAGGIPLLITKVIPPLLALITAYKAGESLGNGNSKKHLIQGLIAIGIIVGYLLRQYKRFINKKIQFSKMLSDSLYFKNLANNSGVFPSIIDTAEEEELKETILAYSFLHKSNSQLSAKELDEKIERWFHTHLNRKIDFDIEDALYKLSSLGIVNESNGKWRALPLNEALIKIDQIWDNYFHYNV